MAGRKAHQKKLDSVNKMKEEETLALPKTVFRKTDTALPENERQMGYLTGLLDRIEESIHSAGAAVKKTSDEVRLQSTLGISELMQNMDKKESWLWEKRMSLPDITKIAHEFLDTAAVKWNLAKMDAAHEIEPLLARVDRLQAEAKSVSSAVSDDATEVFRKIRNLFSSERAGPRM